MADTSSRYPPVQQEVNEVDRNEVQKLVVKYTLSDDVKNLISNIGNKQHWVEKFKKLYVDISVCEKNKYHCEDGVLYKLIDGV